MTVPHNPGNLARLNAAHAGTSITIVEGSSPFLKSDGIAGASFLEPGRVRDFRQWLIHAGQRRRGYSHLDL
jgi:hypothetical protein